MNYKLLTIPYFDKQLKRLIKKYPSFAKEFGSHVDSIKNQPNQGTPLGNSCYKIRLAIASKGKGKSGGARMITYVISEENIIYLLSIYDKSERTNISDKELLNLVKLTK